MNLFDLSDSEQPQKGIVRTKQGGWAGNVKVGDVVNINNETFRVVGPPCYYTKMLRAEIENGYIIIKPDGSRSYYDMQDKPHRDDGPAAIHSNGTEMWYYDGDLHREDGPAVTWEDGTVEYWIHGEQVSKEDLP